LIREGELYKRGASPLLDNRFFGFILFA